MRLALGLAILLVGGCASAPPGTARAPSATVPFIPATSLRAAGPPRFKPDDPACGAVGCVYRVLVSQVWDLVRR